MAQFAPETWHSPRVDLQRLLLQPEGKILIEFSLDLSHLDFFGEKPIEKPVHVSASVTNHAGALHLEGQVSSLLTQCCDRCLVPFTREKVVVLNHLLATSLEDEEHEEIILLDGTTLPLDEVATTAFILEMDTKTLCDDHCLGLCATCGANLNENPCGCSKNSDSPFAALASLLEEKSSS
ncbi:MAG: DUF177 domain-containing protein [Eubacteriales bacterium]